MSYVSLNTLVERVCSGEAVISFPTDTVYALATRPDQAERIFDLKQRDRTKPLILLGATPESLWPFVQSNSEAFPLWQKVAAHYWPGALTLVLPAGDRLPRAVNPLDPTTIGIRVPNHPLALKILTQTGPLATTSANRSGEPPLPNSTTIATAFPDVLQWEGLRENLSNNDLSFNDLSFNKEERAIAPQNPVPLQSSGMPSTVAQWTPQGWHILRQGMIQLENPT